MITVSNSSALMHLGAMGEVDLLRQLFSEILIPAEVYDEVVIRGAGKPGAAEVSAAGWIKRRAVTNILALAVLETRLGAGEAAVIVLAAETAADIVILDDRRARVEAQAQGLRVVGTVGVLLQAARQALVDLPVALDALLATGFRLRASERQRVLDGWTAEQQTAGSP